MTDVIVEKNVGAEMRDGTVLRADVYRPAAEGRYPVLVQRTPYNKEMWPLTAVTLDPVRAAAAGFVVVIQDVRGRWASDGQRTAPNDFFADHLWRGGAFLLGTLAMWTLQAIGPNAVVRAHGGTPELVPSLV